jgi:hypothetical protein
MSSNTGIPFSGPTDRWGKCQRDPVPPPPLGFDRVMENRAPTSNSALFKLPVEILGHIVGFVDPSSLSSLAQVNRDSRQLARSRQFAAIHLDYSPGSVALVYFLVSETNERMINNGSTSLPSLGACIRRMTVATSQAILRQRFDIPEIDHHNDQELYNTLAAAQAPKWQVAYTAVEEVYLPLVNIILGYRPTLPHLESLDWEDNISLSPSFFSALACSSIQHLKLYRPRVDHDFEIKLPQSHVSQGWPLRTLHMEWGLEFNNASTARISASILRLCAPTLETLIWSNLRNDDYQTFGLDPLPNFPCLRNLQLESFLPRDTSVVDALLKSKLVNLSISFGPGLLDKVLESRGRIPTLMTLAMLRPPLKFLRANTQLSKVDFRYSGFSAEVLEIEVLPPLSTFSNLTSLRVIWPETCSLLPETGLRLVSKLHGLNQLCIGSGIMLCWRRNFEVDHDEIRQYLSSLQHLRKLALQGDTYDSGIHFSNSERYYIDTYAISDDLGYEGMDFADVPGEAITPMINKEAGAPYWEKRHRRKMIGEAEKYMGVLPGLEWIYLGERAMCIESDNGAIGARRIVSISEVEGSWSYFNQMFGRS